MIKIVINGQTIYSDSSPKGEEDFEAYHEAMREGMKQMHDSFFRGFPFGAFLQPPSDIHKALQYFGFNELPSESELRVVFKTIAKKTHPDAVGDEKFTKKFVEARKHYDILKKYIKENK